MRLSDLEARVSRRSALAWLGGVGLAALLPSCADEGSSAEPSATTSTGSRAADCILMPELTEGPYYLDLDRVRRDITEGRPGTPLALRVNVVDVDGCKPIDQAAVDIWHCDAGGEYSGVGGASGNTFLRGIQITDADGLAEFDTIFPGWYPGRAVHIHVKVAIGSDETHTGQLFFDDAVTKGVYRAEPYAGRPEPDTPNSADSLFGQSSGATVVTVTDEDESYEGAVTLGVQRA